MTLDRQVRRSLRDMIEAGPIAHALLGGDQGGRLGRARTHDPFIPNRRRVLSIREPVDWQDEPRFASARTAASLVLQPLGFQPDRYALGGQIDAKPLAGFQQLDDYPVLVL
jgi:hypothetical protein